MSHEWAPIMLLLAESGGLSVLKAEVAACQGCQVGKPRDGCGCPKATGPGEAKPVPVTAPGPCERPTFFQPWRRQASQGAAWGLIFYKSIKLPLPFEEFCPLGGAAWWREKGGSGSCLCDLGQFVVGASVCSSAKLQGWTG